MLLAAVVASASAIGIGHASAGPAGQRGAFALLGGTPKVVSTFWAEHGSGLTATLRIRQFALDGTTPILNYDVDMQKLMHLIVVRDDFATFAHLHPNFDAATGTFSQSFTKERNHRYYVYADTIPRGIGQQVFRFTIESDGPIAHSRLPRAGLAPSAAVGRYTLTLGTTTLAANHPQRVDLTVSKAGRPADDLGTYLGAAAHAVFINTRTLDYVHLHPTLRGAADMAMGPSMSVNAQAGPLMQMSLPGLPVGFYRLWIQFRGANDTVYTAPFTILAR